VAQRWYHCSVSSPSGEIPSSSRPLRHPRAYPRDNAENRPDHFNVRIIIERDRMRSQVTCQRRACDVSKRSRCAVSLRRRVLEVRRAVLPPSSLTARSNFWTVRAPAHWITFRAPTGRSMETYRMWDSALNIPRVATRTTRSIRSLLRGGTCRIRHVGRSCWLRWLVPALPIPGIGVTTALGTIHAVCTSEQTPLMETRKI